MKHIRKKIDWQANRILSKLNYVVHTDAVKTYIVPTLTEEQKKFVYAEEADVLNVPLFGMTVKEWRKSNPELAKKRQQKVLDAMVKYGYISKAEANNISGVDL